METARSKPLTTLTWTSEYRVTIQVGPNLLMTSKQKFRFSICSLYENSTLYNLIVWSSISLRYGHLGISTDEELLEMVLDFVKKAVENAGGDGGSETATWSPLSLSMLWYFSFHFLGLLLALSKWMSGFLEIVFAGVFYHFVPANAYCQLDRHRSFVWSLVRFRVPQP